MTGKIDRRTSFHARCRHGHFTTSFILFLISLLTFWSMILSLFQLEVEPTISVRLALQSPFAPRLLSPRTEKNVGIKHRILSQK